MKCDFYSSNTCYEVSDNDMHNITKYDIIDDFDNEIYKPLLTSYESLLNINDNEWIKIFDKWLLKYFTDNLNSIVDRNDSFKNKQEEIELSHKYMKKFNSTKFRLLQFNYVYNNGNVIVYLNEHTIKNIIKSYNYVKLYDLYVKYGIKIPYKEVIYKFKYK